MTISSGAGYSTVPAGVATVKWNENRVTINVDRQYAAERPTVTDNGTPVTVSGNPSDLSAASYTYTLSNVKDNHTVAISVTKNEVRQVSFYVAKPRREAAMLIAGRKRRRS